VSEEDTLSISLGDLITQLGQRESEISMAKRSLTRDQILDAIKRTASELGKRPSRPVFIGHTGISEYQVLKHFPNWNSAVEAAGLEPDTTNVQIDDDELLRDWGRLVRELRQIPTRVQYRHYGKFSPGSFEHHFGPWSRLPDTFREFAVDKDEWNDVLVGVGKWQRVRIEFEYESRSFRDHGHPVDRCDVIVCWRHNWSDCPAHIEVVELSEVIEQLARSDE